VREYLGFWQFLRHLPRVLYDTFLATREPGPILLRMGNISNCCWLWLLLRRRPYAVDILGRAGMGPRHVKNVQILGLNRLLGWLGELLVRTQVRLARCANYVAGYQQQLYPTGSRQHEFVVTDVILPKEAFAKPRPLERFAGQPYRILAIGRVEPEKGHQFLVEAAAELRRRGLDNFVLDIVGPGSQLEPMRQRASQLGLDGRVRFPGRVAMGDPVRQLLDQADLFVLPSLTEGMPRALLEAIARSVPAIGTAAGGTAEVLPAELLVPPSDAKALADKMAEVLHPERLAAMSALSWQLVRKFDPAVILEQRRQFWRVVGRLCSPTAV
jgi:glycosyltransferase involved in cell wall biosynthesis